MNLQWFSKLTPNVSNHSHAVNPPNLPSSTTPEPFSTGEKGCKSCPDPAQCLDSDKH